MVLQTSKACKKKKERIPFFFPLMVIPVLTGRDNCSDNRRSSLDASDWLLYNQISKPWPRHRLTQCKLCIWRWWQCGLFRPLLERSHLTTCFLTIVTSCSGQRSHLRNSQCMDGKENRKFFQNRFEDVFFLVWWLLGELLLTTYFLLIYSMNTGQGRE